jgi:transcriptional regulator with XRE-family HTH domain
MIELNQITPDFKLRCIEAIKANSFKYKTNKAQAVTLGISGAQFSRILKGETERVISDEKFMAIGSKYNVPLEGNFFDYKTANTKVYNYIYSQLETCQKMSISGLFCDKADIGKTASAKEYVQQHRNAYLIDGSNNKSRTLFLRAIAKEIGIEHNIPLRMLQVDLNEAIACLTNPIFIIDEMGDLEYPAFLELKSLWNSNENKCAWYGMGADGLQHKIDRCMNLKRVGYAEVFRRFGSRYQSIIPKEEHKKKAFLIDEIQRILKVNPSKLTPLQMYAKTGGSLTRVFIELKKESLGIA